MERYKGNSQVTYKTIDSLTNNALLGEDFIRQLHEKLEELEGVPYSVVDRKTTLAIDLVWFTCDQEDIEGELRLHRIKDTVVISRVQMVNQRHGVFTELMDEINNWARTAGVEILKIESVSSPEMQRWCEKNHFIVTATTAFVGDDGVTYGDYCRPVYKGE